MVCGGLTAPMTALGRLWLLRGVGVPLKRSASTSSSNSGRPPRMSRLSADSLVAMFVMNFPLGLVTELTIGSDYSTLETKKVKVYSFVIMVV